MHKFRGCHLTPPTSETELTKDTGHSAQIFPPNIPTQNNETLNLTTGKTS